MAIELIASFFPYGQGIMLFGLGIMVLGFVGVGTWELLRPARRGAPGRDGRMTINFGLGVLNMTLSAVLPISSLAMAMLAESKGWGLFQMWPVQWYVALLILLLAKSLVGYAMHRAFHEIPWLWPLHVVHHRDDAIDLSTSFRSHPVSHVMVVVPHALLSILFGASVWVVLVAEAILFLCALFQHANLELPDAISEQLERWLVTPRMHLVHHARERHLHDGNYGEIFSFWDHWFGTFRRQPDAGMEIGVAVPERSAWWLRRSDANE